MSAAPETINHTSVGALRQPLPPSLAPDQRVDLFSLRGFELAQRIGKALATSNAVPAAYRAFTEKKGQGGAITYLENPSAMGNCLIAIEVAQSVGMSITAVMQNANVIEGQLRWSGKFVIAAINASHRFTPLRFDIQNRGMIKATYKEKQGWNDQLRRFDFKDVSIEVENLVCIAWALPYGFNIPHNVRTLQEARDAKLPLIESAPVSIQMAVEEGWYAKSGSKWQTEMKHLMLQYRAGSFFGNIHAPDVVMGMGRTQEEAEDITTIDVAPDGRVTNVTTEEMRRPAGEKTPPAEVVQKNDIESKPDPAAGPGQPAATTDAAGDIKTAADVAEKALNQMADDVLTYAVVVDAIVKATTELEVQAAVALIARVEDAMQQAELNAKATARSAEIAKPAATATSRRRATPSQPLE